MGTILPDNPADQLDFFKSHADVWAERAPEIGISAELAQQVVDLTAAAEEAKTAAYEAQRAALAATQAWKLASRILRQTGGAAIRLIKAHAQMTDNINVLVQALLDAPEKPGPKRGSRPGSPTLESGIPNIRWTTASPNAWGNIEVEWSAGVGATMGAGAGVFYRLERSLDGGPITMLEMVPPPGPGRRSVKFLDTTVPFGTRTVMYYVTPVKGAGSGPTGLPARVEFGGTNAPRAHDVHVRPSAISTQTQGRSAA